MSDPALFPSKTWLAMTLLARQAAVNWVSGVSLSHDFVDVCTDHDNVEAGEQRFDGFNGLPVVQTARDRCAGRRNQRTVSRRCPR